MALVKEKTLGVVRYFNVYLTFPDGDTWKDSVPFVHDLQWELKRFKNQDPLVQRDLLLKGEAYFTDHNGVKHLIKISDKQESKVWGKKHARSSIN